MRQYRTLKFAAGPLGPALFCVQGKFPPRPSRTPLMLIPGWRPPQLLNVAYNRGLIRAEIRPPPGHMKPFSCQAGREHERLSARPQQTIPLCTQKAKNLRFRKEAETRMDTRCQIC